jgi:hypothetical protein
MKYLHDFQIAVTELHDFSCTIQKLEQIRAQQNNVAKMAVETTSVNPVTTAWHPEVIEPKMIFDYGM